MSPQAGPGNEKTGETGGGWTHGGTGGSDKLAAHTNPVILSGKAWLPDMGRK